MSILTIYTPQNGQEFRDVLNAIVMFMNTSTFEAALWIMGIFAGVMASYQYIYGKRLSALFHYIGVSFLVTVCLLGMRTSVAIIDMQTAEGAGEAWAVDHVPIGLALPGAIVSGIGYGITMGFSAVLHTVDDLDYNRTGMVFGSRTWLTANNAQLSSDPELARDMSSYIRQCIFAAKLLGSQQISANDLKNSTDLNELFFKAPSKIFRVLFHNGENLSCADAASTLQTRLKGASDKELKRLSAVLFRGDGTHYKKVLEAANSYFMGVTTDASLILTQNILINATRHAAQDAFAFAGAEAELMNYTNTTSMQKMHIAEANSFWLASFRLPYFMAVFWMLTVCIFPLVALIALFPSLSNVYVVYLQSQVYLWSWPPLFVIINFFVSLASSKTISIFGNKTGGITLSNADGLSTIHSSFAFTAGALAASVTVIAYYITKGLSSVLSTASQHFGGMAQSLSTSEAQSVAQGNVSMGNYSGWNMNYDNTNAHKFDTNYSHAEGRETVQMNNGSLLSQDSNGAHVVNAQPALSQMATKLHASERLVSSLSDQANNSLHHASTYRSAAEEHYQHAFSGLSQFNETDANDTREGAGLSSTVSNALNEDIRTMQDAVEQYNTHHDKSTQVSIEGAVSGSIDSKRAIWGKIANWGTGLSAQGSITGRGQASLSSSAQNFLNSSEGQSFSSALNHLETSAKNHHLDTQDSANLSQSEQIASNLTKGHSLSELASSEYSKSEQYSHMAQRAKEDASSIDVALDQAFHDWVVTAHGAQGEQALLGTDAYSIAAQQQLAHQFMNSHSGTSALSAQVDRYLHQQKAQIKPLHEQEQQTLSKNQTQLIQEEQTKTKNEVGDTARAKQFHTLSKHSQQEAKVLSSEEASVSISERFNQQNELTENQIEQSQKELVHQGRKNQHDFQQKNHPIKKEMKDE
jgi:conjugal transfer mating pair stabilization protein TraG